MVFERCVMFILPVLLLLLGAGCRTSQPLPAADFATPGWRVQQGQAVWKPPQDRPELAGDLLLATNANGNFFLQFSKIPFPLVTAQTSGDQWQIEFGADEYSWHGRDRPPERFGWFQLPLALRGAEPGGHWQFTNMAGGSWRLRNPHTGETVEGAFFP